MKLTPVPTPNNIEIANANRKTLESIGKFITAELKTQKKWTKSCTALLQDNPKCLFLFDRFEYCLANAYGADYKIALNPCQILCYHPDCLKVSRRPVKLRVMFVLTEFIEHIQEHVDEIGAAMQQRFGAITENVFSTRDELDKLSPAPFLLNRNARLMNGTMKFIEDYGIERIMHQFTHMTHFEEYWHNPRLPKPKNPNYICHWKDILISKGIIKCSSLSFQEDDALIFNILQFPDPVPDWSVWQTISLYALKLLCAISGPALNLYRGVTFNRLILNKPNSSKSLPTVEEFASNINHASPSVTNIEQKLPELRFDNRQYHPSEILYHIKCTLSLEDSFIFRFSSMVTRVPCCIQVDEQEINQGIFIKHGELCGLQDKVSVDDIKRIGLENFAKYISKENNYVIAVREYRVIDFRGIFCSNAFTSFESKTLISTECKKDLDEVIRFACSCFNCLMNGETCKMDQIDQPCSICASQNIKCESLLVFHNLWDMGSSQKKTEKEHDGLQLCRSYADMLDSKRYTIGFGGLHLAKALVNSARNHVMQFDGENFSINILIALRHSNSILEDIKNSVFVGKDRQSDLLSYLTVCPMVQEALTELKQYSVQRVPEKYTPYKKNAASHKKIVHVTDICCNRNGDVFVLDSGSSCLHVIDRSIVAMTYMIGKYMCPNTLPYPKDTVNNRNTLRFSQDLKDLSMNSDDDLFISDAGREEVVIIKNCCLPKKNFCFYVLKVKGILSVAFTDKLFVLVAVGDEKLQKVVQILSFDVPLKKSDSKKLYLNFTVAFEIPGENVSCLFSVPFSKRLGLVQDDHVKFLAYSKTKSCTKAVLDVKSTVKPFLSREGLLVTSSNSKIDVHKISYDGKVAKLEHISCYNGKGVVLGCCISGKTVSVILKDQSSLSVVEFGSLDFAVKYTNAIYKLYQSIGYIPPRGDKSIRSSTLRECIDNGEECLDLFMKMQKEAEERFKGRKSFMGPEGIPFSDTIYCLQATIQSWKVLHKRMEIIEEGSAAKILPHTFQSESYIEHSFGNVKKGGQGHNQTMEEYIISKRRVALDFQFKMCKMPFWQHSKEKLQDKGYQELESNNCSVSVENLKTIFARSQKNMVTPTIITVEDEHLLKKAFFLGKSVPRQSNRSKWRERSGHQPNMLVEKSSGILYAGDLVCYFSITKELMYLIVQTEVHLDDVTNEISVSEPDSNLVFNINCEKLLHKKGQLFTVPTELYQLKDGIVELSNLVQEELEEYRDNSTSKTLTDEEWALLLEDKDVSKMDSIKEIDMEVESVSKEAYSSGILDNRYYIIQLSNKKSFQHFIARTDTSKSRGKLYWMQFLEKTIEPGTFVIKEGDTGHVSLDEIICVLDNPTDDLISSSRSGKLTFSLEQLAPYIDTLQ